MKTIEERARKYSKGQWDEPTAIKAYKQGYHDAIEEACKWIDKYLHLFVMKGNILYPKLAQEFRKAMEE